MKGHFNWKCHAIKAWYHLKQYVSYHTLHSQFLKRIILKFNSSSKYCSSGHIYFLLLPQQSSLLGLYGPVLLHLLGNTGIYTPSCQTNTENQLFQYCPTRKDNTGSIASRNWECLYYDSSLDIQWNLASALRKSLGLRPRDFPRAQAIFTVYPSSRHNTDTDFMSCTCCQLSIVQKLDSVKVEIWESGPELNDRQSMIIFTFYLFLSDCNPRFPVVYWIATSP